MKTTILKTFVCAAFGLAVTSALSMGADFTWQGNGGDWSVGANWAGNAAPTGAGNVLYFEGLAQTSNNDDQLTSVNGIHFNEGAGAFDLTGTVLNLAGNIVNNSANDQTISLDLTMTANRTFDIKSGKLIVGGNIGQNGGNRILIKDGSGSLELRGVNTYQNNTQINRGTLILDASTGSIHGSSPVNFGLNTTWDLGNTAAFEVKGANASVNSVSVVNRAANKIKASGIALTIGTFTKSPPEGTINFNIATSGSSISFTNDPAMTNDILTYGTVTDASGTDFATIVSGQVQRQTTFTTLLATGNGSATVNFSTSGDLNRGTNWASINSLTVIGTGSLASTHNDGVTLNALLMREGVGDYTVNSVLRSTGAAYLFLHQQSTAGTLILNGRLQNANASAQIIKAGEGTVRIGETSSSSYTGATRVQTGELILDGELTRTGSVIVYDGGTLSGGGTLGTTSATAVSIYAGGTIAGTTSDALDITGTLSLESDSTFFFTLDYADVDSLEVSGAINLASGVDLQLALAAAPASTAPVYLLTSDTGITGDFATLNGAVIGVGDTFSLTYDFATYDFQYFSDGQNIWVQAIPEPSVVLLGAFGLLVLLLRCRGRQVMGNHQSERAG